MQNPSQNASETLVSPGRASELADKAEVRIEEMTDTAHKTVDQIADSASSAAWELGRQGERLISAQRRWAKASCRAMSRHPVASVAIAAVAGLLLGRLAEGRQRCPDPSEHAGWRG